MGHEGYVQRGDGACLPPDKEFVSIQRHGTSGQNLAGTDRSLKLSSDPVFFDLFVNIGAREAG